MLVKFTDIQIRPGCSIASFDTTACKQESGSIINLFDLNFESLFVCSNSPEQQMLHWAGKEILTGKYKFIASSLGKQLKPLVDNNLKARSVTTDAEILPQFLYYYLYFKKNQIAIATKNGQRISKGKLAKAEVPIPGLNTQKNLLPVLKKLFENNETHIRQIKKAISQIEKEHDLANLKAFKYLVRFQMTDGDKPAEKKIARIKDAATIQAGKTPNGSIKSYFGKDYPLYTQLAFQQGMNIRFAYKHLSKRGMHEAKLFPENSILVCFIGAQFGRAGIARKAGACNSQILSVSCNETSLPEYIYYQVISDQFQKQMRHFATDYSISKTDFENLSIELPSLKKQQDVIDSLGRHYEMFDKKLNALKVALEIINGKQFEAFSNLLASHIIS